LHGTTHAGIEKMQFIAHRGVHRQHAENSLGNSSLGFLDAAQAARDRHPRIRTIVGNYELLDAATLKRAQLGDTLTFRGLR